MEIAVCEDEEVFSKLLVREISGFFKQHGEETDISVFSDGLPLEEECKKGKKFDIIFLDIQLENSDGVQIAEQIRSFDKKVTLIFVTSIENRVFEGYMVSAFDYIVKSSINERLPVVLERFTDRHKDMRLTIMTPDGDTVILPFFDIIWVESDGRGTVIGTADRVISTAVPVGKISSKLSDDKFIEIHKSVYVQIEKIKCIKSDSVELSCGKILPMSRRKRKAVMSAVMTAMREV